MTRTKHLLIIGGILAVAMLLNVTCCRWAIHSEVAGYQAPILAFRHGTGQTVAPGNVAGVWTGVLARPPLSTLTASLLGVVLPVAPGRNLAVLVETAVRKETLMHSGYDAATEFADRQLHQMQQGEP